MCTTLESDQIYHHNMLNIKEESEAFDTITFEDYKFTESYPNGIIKEEPVDHYEIVELTEVTDIHPTVRIYDTLKKEEGSLNESGEELAPMCVDGEKDGYKDDIMGILCINNLLDSEDKAKCKIEQLESKIINFEQINPNSNLEDLEDDEKPSKLVNKIGSRLKPSFENKSEPNDDSNQKDNPNPNTKIYSIEDCKSFLIHDHSYHQIYNSNTSNISKLHLEEDGKSRTDDSEGDEDDEKDEDEEDEDEDDEDEDDEDEDDEDEDDEDEEYENEEHECGEECNGKNYKEEKSKKNATKSGLLMNLSKQSVSLKKELTNLASKSIKASQHVTNVQKLSSRLSTSQNSIRKSNRLASESSEDSDFDQSDLNESASGLLNLDRSSSNQPNLDQTILKKSDLGQSDSRELNLDESNPDQSDSDQSVAKQSVATKSVANQSVAGKSTLNQSNLKDQRTNSSKIQNTNFPKDQQQIKPQSLPPPNTNPKTDESMDEDEDGIQYKEVHDVDFDDISLRSRSNSEDSEDDHSCYTKSLTRIRENKMIQCQSLSKAIAEKIRGNQQRANMNCDIRIKDAMDLRKCFEGSLGDELGEGSGQDLGLVRRHFSPVNGHSRTSKRMSPNQSKLKQSAKKSSDLPKKHQNSSQLDTKLHKLPSESPKILKNTSQISNNLQKSSIVDLLSDSSTSDSEPQSNYKKPPKSHQTNQKPSHNFPIKCSECPLIFHDSLRLNRHKKTHQTPQFQCRNCLRKFKRESMLEKHFCDIKCLKCPDTCTCQMNNSTDCIICQKINFRYFTDYKEHMLSHHNEIVYCKICEKNNFTLFKHKQLKHDVVRSFRCTECTSILKSKEQLEYHKEIHAKNFPCSKCNKIFTRRYLLNQHELTHENPKQFHCDICDKNFQRKYCLDNHRKVIHGDKMKEMKYLMKHRGMNRKESVGWIKCDKCPALFKSKTSYQWHLRQAH